MNSKVFKILVRLPSGTTTKVTVEATAPGIAKQMVESQYGVGSFAGFI